MERECPPGTIRNPATGRCVKEDGPIGRRLRRVPIENNGNRNENRNRNDCPEGTIRNPATGRCVKIDGPIGRRLVVENTPRNETSRSGGAVRGPEANDCPPGMIRNPATRRCVREDGPTGRRILRRRAVANIPQPVARTMVNPRGPGIPLVVNSVVMWILSNRNRGELSLNDFQRTLSPNLLEQYRRLPRDLINHLNQLITLYNISPDLFLETLQETGRFRVERRPVRVPSEDRIRRQFRTQNSIRRFLHERNDKHLQNISDQDLRAFLKKFAKKDVDGNRQNLLKQLENWNKSLLPKEETKEKKKKTKQKKNKGILNRIFGRTEESSSQDSSERVHDAYQMEDVPIKDFLEEDGRILLKEGKHKYGVYLQQIEWIYECVDGVSFNNYINNKKMRPIIRLPTTSGAYFYIYRDELLPLLQKGHNEFRMKTSSKKIKVCSKSFLETMNAMNRFHCNKDNLIVLSSIVSSKKRGKGLVINGQLKKKL